ncbi:MAG: hypothetical protein QM647_09250 [Asticcacaulis sp.]|uniref:hypothetical protein n=1 Tax=Asticcacaulis sp. TaxID=1872648 RepID=UPI0039E484CD
MATMSAVHFEPTTDTFGQLTLHAHRHASNINLLMVLAFVATLIVALFVIGMIDSAVFEHAHNPTTYYGGVALDYD